MKYQEMQIRHNKPARVYFCGHENKVQIADVASVDLLESEHLVVKNSLCRLFVSCDTWGMRISVRPSTLGYLSVAGACWRRAHVMFYSERNAETYFDYSASEKHLTFWKNVIVKRTNLDERCVETLCLNENQQVTLTHKGYYDLDITSKSWGCYITPSLFSRCKKFDLLPYFFQKNGVFEILMIFQNEHKRFVSNFLTLNKSSITKLDEHDGFVAAE